MGNGRAEETLSLRVFAWPDRRTELETDFFRICGGEIREEPGILSRGEARIGRMVGLIAEVAEEEGEPQEKGPEGFGGGERLVVLIVR